MLRPVRVNPAVAAFLSTATTCKGYGTKRLLLLMGGVGLLLVVVWGITTAVSGKSSQETAKPKRVKDINAKVLELGLSSQAALETAGTPQYHAVQWLANVDKQKLKASDPFLIQRYILAVIFYSTAGTEEHIEPHGNWKNQTALAQNSFALLAAAEMARQHFNARDASIVPWRTWIAARTAHGN